MTAPTPKRRDAREMYPLIEQYLRRPQKQADFCRAHGLPKAVFAYWLARYRRTGKPEEFVELLPQSASYVPSPALEVEYPNGVKIRLQGDISMDYLRLLLQLNY
jgi:hypothetical protein